jgi:hypothetical protein
MQDKIGFEGQILLGERRKRGETVLISLVNASEIDVHLASGIHSCTTVGGFFFDSEPPALPEPHRQLSHS